MVHDIVLGRSFGDIAKYGTEGTIFLGKQYVTMGKSVSLANRVLIDVINPHTILIAGKRGSGKCLDGDTLVTLENGVQKPIKELADCSEKILSLNEKLKIVKAERTNFFKRSVNRLVKLTLRSGKEIKLTPEHPILTLNGWKAVQEITIGGRVATHKSHNVETNIETIPKTLNLFALKGAVGYNERNYYIQNGNTLMKIAQAEQNEFLELLADSDIFWDEITKMELLEGDFEVFDITVPKFSNFVANDIIVHNSYTMGVMSEGIAMLPEEVAKKISCLFFDTMGIYWTMKFPNQRDDDLLDEWKLESAGYDTKVNVYVPAGKFDELKEKRIPVDKAFSISCNELSGSDWCDLLNIDLLSPVGIAIARTSTILLETKKPFEISDIKKVLLEDKRTEMRYIDAAVNAFEVAESWGLFSKKGTDIYELLEPGKINVLDISVYGHTGSFSIRALVIGLITRKVLEERIIARKLEELEDIERGWRYFGEEFRELKERQVPLVWIFLDEAHEFLPESGITLATKPLIQLIREGRQPGISVVLATQQPGKIHTDVITQSDLVISHRLTAKVDISALNNVMQTYLAGDIQKYMSLLPSGRGSAVVLDDKQERLFPIQIRPRITWHGGAEPSLVKPKPQRVGEAVEEEE